jgi:hypothetical protein
MQLENMSHPYVMPRSDDVAGGVRAAGLSLDAGNAVHFHVHLQVLLMAGEVEVPGGIGIAPGGGVSPVHTHDTSGIIHVEADAAQPFTLGQLFTEWGQPLGPDSIGRVHARPGYSIMWFVDGQRVSDPASVVLRPHQVIVAFEDAANAVVNAPSYSWPSGY